MPGGEGKGDYGGSEAFWDDLSIGCLLQGGCKMAAFTLDIKGQLNNMRLSESKALWPLFEAVVNAIQAIEDSPNSKNGKITIFAQREMTGQENMSPQETLERFESTI